MITVAEIMTTELETLGPDDMLADARRLMTERHIHHVPIVDGERLVGLISHRDVLAATGSWQTQPDETTIPLSQVMRTELSTVSPDTQLRAAALHMEKHRFGCLPVLENEMLCGIVTETDFVGLAANLLEQIEQNEPVER